jgi:hypothetical protein
MMETREEACLSGYGSESLRFRYRCEVSLGETIRVFLSSTSKDLEAYRETAAKAIQRLAGYECVYQGFFTGSTHDPDTLSREKVKECDLFVGILGPLYGSTPPAEQQSYTEREYDMAVESGKPRLMFVCPDDFPLSDHLRETDEQREKQQAFRKKVQGAVTTPGQWRDRHELALEVILGIVAWERGQFKTYPKQRRRLSKKKSRGDTIDHGLTHPFADTASMLAASATSQRPVSGLWYIPGPPGSLKTQVLEDIAARLDGKLTLVALTVDKGEAVTMFFPRLRDQLAAQGIDCASADSTVIADAARRSRKKILVLLDNYHGYFLEKQNDMTAMDRWLGGLKRIAVDGVMVVLSTGSIDPSHLYAMRFPESRRPASSPTLFSPARLEGSWDAWAARLASSWSIDSERLREIRARSEGHPRSFLQGASALASKTDAARAIDAWQRWAGNLALSVVPDCCGQALILAATGGDLVALKHCVHRLLEAGFLREDSGGRAVPAVSIWRDLWAQA